MRTTLSLDEDVAVLIQRLRQSRKAGLKRVVNEALRLGLRQMAAPPKRRKPYRIKPLPAGRCLIPNLDNIAEALAVAEGEAFR
jgi:hypothetical protein